LGSYIALPKLLLAASSQEKATQLVMRGSVSAAALTASPAASTPASAAALQTPRAAPSVTGGYINAASGLLASGTGGEKNVVSGPGTVVIGGNGVTDGNTNGIAPIVAP
jgi:hypothetical protein